MKIHTSHSIRTLDKRAAEHGSMPGVVLMENAGRAVFEAMVQKYGDLRGRDVHVACGTGNNGGDGFVVARYLRLAGAWVTISIAGDPESITGDALTHFRIMHDMGIEPWPASPGPVYVKVDALMGTGAKGAPHGEVAEAIRRLNADHSPTVAVDIPSGVDPDTGIIAGDAVRAAMTVTFAFPKPGLFLLPGADNVGELVVDSIGFDWESLNPESSIEWIQPRDLESVLPRRKRDAHKGMFGHLLCVGGSLGMSGAITMTAKSAIRTGVGLVSIATSCSAQPIIAGSIQEAMTIPLEEKSGSISEGAFDQIKSASERCDAICIGPGLTNTPDTSELVRRVLAEIPLPVVVDADGLNVLAGKPEWTLGRRQPVIMTPHPGECGRLLGVSTHDVQSGRLVVVRETAYRYGAIVALKGAGTVIADGRGVQEHGVSGMVAAFNTTGNPGMSTGGAGDVLTGIIGALLAQGIEAFDAVRLGVYLHGCAGDVAAESLGIVGLKADDIIEALPSAIRALQNKGIQT